MGEPVLKEDMKFKIFSSPKDCTIHFSGAINENSDFSGMDLGAAKVLILDLHGVTSLNSMGLRNWVNWVKGVKNKMQLHFRQCPRVVVDQMNVLQGFLPMGAVVESFFVPYHCDACQHEENYLATRGKDYMEGTVDTRDGIVMPETRPCPVCAAQMDWDIVPLKYFSFLKYRK